MHVKIRLIHWYLALQVFCLVRLIHPPQMHYCDISELTLRQFLVYSMKRCKHLNFIVPEFQYASLHGTWYMELLVNY